MRTPSFLVVFFLFLTAIHSVAQLPNSGAATTSDRQAPPVTLVTPQSLDSFSGSGTVDKLVPGVVQLSLLDALDRGLKHNLGLLLSHEQTEQARAQYRRQLSALLPNISGNASSINSKKTTPNWMLRSRCFVGS